MRISDWSSDVCASDLDTTLARIIRMVQEAHGRRAQVEQWVEKFAAVYTPAVIAVALAIFLVPSLAFGAAWAEWFYRALVLLVIACPCPLVISTRSEEHTSELQSLMRISYAVFCFKKK